MSLSNSENNSKAIICPKCKQELPEDSQFCHFCGANIEAPVILPEENNPQETIIEPSPVIHTLNHTETVKKSKKKPIIIGIISAVAVALIALLIILLVGNKGKDTDIYNVGVRTISFEDKFTAEYVLDTWENGSQTEKSMIEIMDEYGSEQGGGQLYIITRGEFVEEIEEWCFSPKRKKGDYAIIENAYGFSLCYYSGFNLEQEELNEIQNNGNSLVVAVEPDFHPYSWEENGKFYGLHVDIAKEVAKRNGFTAEFVSANWEDLFAGIENGTYNLVLGIEPTEEREEAFYSTPASFTDVYYDGMAALFNVKEFEFSFSEWSNFKFTIKEMVEDGTIATYLSKYDLAGQTTSNQQTNNTPSTESTAQTSKPTQTEPETTKPQTTQPSQTEPETTKPQTNTPTQTEPESTKPQQPTSITCLEYSCKNVVNKSGDYCSEHKCANSSCSFKKDYNSQYCTVCQCSKVGCKNLKNSTGYYCKEHTCEASGCTSEKAYNKKYCSQHLCGSCDNIRVDGGFYCKEHTCIKTGCTSKKSGYHDSDYCSSHQCMAGMCSNGRIDGGQYCEEHTCIVPGCNKQKLIDDYCYSHTS